MLSAGIVVMAVAVVVGLVVVTVAALTSPGARSAGRRTRTAMFLSEEEDASGHPPAGEGGVQAGGVSRWFLVPAVLSGAGLLLGMLMVMIASIT